MNKRHHHKLKNQCILCNNNDLLELDTINPNTLVSLFKKKFGFDTSSYFNDHKRINYYKCPYCDLRFFFPIIKSSSIFYESLQNFDWYYQKNKNEYNFCSNFTENKNILEIGCGEGFFFEHTKNSLYKGIEFNQKAINTCQKKGLDVEKAFISEFSKFHPNEYDIVCSFQVLEHVENPIHFIKDALFCLKPYGILLLSVPSADSFVSLSRNNILNMPPHHISHWTDSSFHYIAKNLNVKLLDIHHDELEPIHYDWYSRVLGQQLIKTWTFQPTSQLFDRTILDKLSSKFGSLLGIFLKKTITNKILLPRGHTVTAVFEKQ